MLLKNGPRAGQGAGSVGSSSAAENTHTSPTTQAEREMAEAEAELEWFDRYEQHLIEEAEAGGPYWLHLKREAEREAERDPYDADNLVRLKRKPAAGKNGAAPQGETIGGAARLRIATRNAIAAYARTGAMVDAALEYPKPGLPVFPVDPVTKVPIPKRDPDPSGRYPGQRDPARNFQRRGAEGRRRAGRARYPRNSAPRFGEMSRAGRTPAHNSEGNEMKNIKLFKVTEVVDLQGRKNVPCNWFVAWRERPLFGRKGSLGLYADVIAPGYDNDCKAAAEEFFTKEEAKAFARFACRFLQISASIEPVTLPLPKDTQSFEMRLGMLGYQLAILKVEDEAGHDLPFMVSCYDDPPPHPVEAALRQLVGMGLVVDTGERGHGQPVYFAVPEDKLEKLR